MVPSADLPTGGLAMMRNVTIGGVAVVSVLVLVGSLVAMRPQKLQTPSGPPQPPTAADAEAVKGKDLQAVVETDKGTITLDLLTDEAPMTVANFKNLADRGFYDGLTFHRVMPDFVIQGGDPKGNGTGGPGYKWDDEESALKQKHDRPGTLSMAHAGPDTQGSQFFITHVPTPGLDGKHAVFGYLAEGQGVVDAIRGGDVMQSVKVVEAEGETPEGE